MIYQLAVILTDVEYKCEFCILSPGQVLSDKFMEIDLAISTQKSLGNDSLFNDSGTTDTTDNNVDQPPPANDAPITNGDTGPPSKIDVDQQDANSAPHRAAPIIQQQNVPQQPTIVQPEETLQHGALANGNAGGAPLPDAGPNPQDSGPTQPPRSTTCKFYAQGSCKHGRRSLSCQLNHPRMCKIIYQKWCKELQSWSIMQFLSPTTLPSISPP